MGARRGKFDEEEAGSLVESSTAESACYFELQTIWFGLAI